MNKTEILFHTGQRTKEGVGGGRSESCCVAFVKEFKSFMHVRRRRRRRDHRAPKAFQTHPVASTHRFLICVSSPFASFNLLRES